MKKSYSKLSQSDAFDDVKSSDKKEEKIITVVQPVQSSQSSPPPPSHVEPASQSSSNDDGGDHHSDDYVRPGLSSRHLSQGGDELTSPEHKKARVRNSSLLDV